MCKTKINYSLNGLQIHTMVSKCRRIANPSELWINGGTIRVTITKATTTATDRQGRTMFDNCWNLGIRYKLTTTRKNP